MPIYVYRCPKGHEHELLRDAHAAHNGSRCPVCKRRAAHVIAAPADKFPGADHWRTRIKSHGEGM